MFSTTVLASIRLSLESQDHAPIVATIQAEDKVLDDRHLGEWWIQWPTKVLFAIVISYWQDSNVYNQLETDLHSEF